MQIDRARDRLRDYSALRWLMVLESKLHHQGDVGEASYDLVPNLVDHQSRRHELDEHLFHFCVLVELQQPENSNPPIPPEFELSYAMATRQLAVIGREHLRRGCTEAVVMGVVAATALAGGHRVLARAYVEFGRLDAIDYRSNLNGFTPSPADK